MTPEQIARWEEQRKKGKPRFVLVTGVLSYGVPMFAITTFALPLLRARPLPSPFAIAFSAGMWLLGGVILGLMLWWVNERNHRLNTGQGGGPNGAP